MRAAEILDALGGDDEAATESAGALAEADDRAIDRSKAFERAVNRRQRADAERNHSQIAHCERNGEQTKIANDEGLCLADLRFCPAHEVWDEDRIEMRQCLVSRRKIQRNAHGLSGGEIGADLAALATKTDAVDGVNGH